VVIDHSPDIRLLFEDLLGAEPYRVTTLPGEPDPAPRVIELLPDIILHDYTPMTAAGDLRSLRTLAADPRTCHIPLVLCSAAPGIDAIAGSVGASPLPVVPKPFSLDDLFATLERLTAARGVTDRVIAD
jgi:CheY-like chemotaxis protein